MGNRRHFIKSGCIACMGLTSIATLIEACSAPMQVVKSSSTNHPNMLSVPESKFTPLIKVVIVRDDKLDSDILLVKGKDGYKALFMSCTHEGLPLTATDTKIVCNAHGSQFDFDGKVLKEPALKPLEQFKTEIINSYINIYTDQKL